MPHYPVSTSKKQETAVLIGISIRSDEEDRLEEYLEELEFLAETAGAITKKRFTQRLDHPDPKTFIGSGKLNEVRDYVKEHHINLVIFDDELSGSQIRNIEKVLNEGKNENTEMPCRVLDR